VTTMPMPTPEQDRQARLVEAAATALAKHTGSRVFLPGQTARDSYCQQAKVVIDAVQAQIASQANTQLRDSIDKTIDQQATGGAFVNIPEPLLREMVAAYVADALYQVAVAAGITTAARVCAGLRGAEPLLTELPEGR